MTLSDGDGELLDGTLDNAAALAFQRGEAQRGGQCAAMRQALVQQKSVRPHRHVLPAGDWNLAARELRHPTGDADIDRDSVALADRIDAALAGETRT